MNIMKFFSFFVVLIPFFAKAEGGINVHNFKAPLNTNFLFTETAEIFPSKLSGENSRIKSGLFSIYYDYVANPLIQVDSNGNRDISLVKDIHTIQMNFLYQFNSKLATSLNVPVHRVNLDGSVNPSDGQKVVMGEFAASVKYRLTPIEQNIQIAIVPEFNFPLDSKSSDYFISSSSPSLGMKIASNFSLDKTWYFGGHVGIKFSPDHKFRESDYSHLMPLSFGVSRVMSSDLDLNLEMSTALSFKDLCDQNIFQIAFGPRFKLGENLVGILNAGTGRLTGDSSLDYRLIAGINIPFSFTFAQEIVKKEKSIKDIHDIYRRNNEISFEGDSYRIDSTGKTQLYEIVLEWDKIKVKESKKIIVSAFSSSFGAKKHNLLLSKKRAREVKKYLVSLGVDESKILAFGLGEISRERGSHKNKEIRYLLDQHARVSIESY